MYFSTARDMASLDDAAVARGLLIRQMMELAGWHILELFNEIGLPPPRAVAVCAGKGNKGGDGLSAARHLANHGYAVSVVVASPPSELKADPAHHLRLLEEMRMPIVEYAREPERARRLIAEADVVIDALIGYRLSGAPEGAFAEIIRLMNNNGRIVSYDLPSGVDATTGECFTPCVRAMATLTLAVPKKIFRTKTGAAKAGKVYVGDLGIPKNLYDAMSEGSRPDFKGRLIQIFGVRFKTLAAGAEKEGARAARPILPSFSAPSARVSSFETGSRPHPVKRVLK